MTIGEPNARMTYIDSSSMYTINIHIHNKDDISEIIEIFKTSK